MAMTSDALVSGSMRDGVLILSIAVDQLRDPDTVYSLRDEIMSQVDTSGTTDLVLDLRHVKSIGSVGFLAFLAVRRHLVDGRIVLCNLSGSVRDVFQISRLISGDASQTAPFITASSVEGAVERLSDGG
jgi:anti-anti-sigma factor